MKCIKQQRSTLTFYITKSERIINNYVIMKKFLLKILAGVGIIILLSFYGCNKDNDIDTEMQKLRYIPERVENVDDTPTPIKKITPIPNRPIKEFVDSYPQKIY